jgi:hypothetical protein
MYSSPSKSPGISPLASKAFIFSKNAGDSTLLSSKMKQIFSYLTLFLKNQNLPRSFHNLSQIVVELHQRVISAGFDLKHRDVVQPGHKPRERGLAHPARTHEKQVSQRLPYNSVNSEQMVEHFIEHDKLNA